MVTTSRVLLIDDNRDLQDIIRIFCARAGYTVRVASNGDAGLAEIETFRPQVLLLDLLMPGRDGFSILEPLATERREQRPERIIVISAYTDRDSLDRLKTLGVDGTLPKPFLLEELRAVLGEPAA